MLQVRELTADEPWVARLRYAYADALLTVGRRDEAREWFARAAEVDEEAATDAAERLLDLDGVVLDEDETYTATPVDVGDADEGDEGDGDEGDEGYGGEGDEAYGDEDDEPGVEDSEVDGPDEADAHADGDNTRPAEEHVYEEGEDDDDDDDESGIVDDFADEDDWDDDLDDEDDDLGYDDQPEDVSGEIIDRAGVVPVGEEPDTTGPDDTARPGP
jgi:hypothetical protein